METIKLSIPSIFSLIQPYGSTGENSCQPRSQSDRLWL